MIRNAAIVCLALILSHVPGGARADGRHTGQYLRGKLARPVEAKIA
jgi:hypothetical protein